MFFLFWGGLVFWGILNKNKISFNIILKAGGDFPPLFWGAWGCYFFQRVRPKINFFPFCQKRTFFFLFKKFSYLKRISGQSLARGELLKNLPPGELKRGYQGAFFFRGGRFKEMLYNLQLLFGFKEGKFYLLWANLSFIGRRGGGQGRE